MPTDNMTPLDELAFSPVGIEEKAQEPTEVEAFLSAFWDLLPLQYRYDPVITAVAIATVGAFIGLLDKRKSQTQTVVHNHQHYHPTRGHVVRVVGQTALMEPGELAASRQEVVGK